MVLGHVTRILH